MGPLPYNMEKGIRRTVNWMKNDDSSEQNKSNVFVTIITVSFNSEKTIKDTLSSVDRQTYTNFEHIIIDGASSDRTIEIVKVLITQNEK